MEQEVFEALKQRNVRVKADWVSQCLAFLRSGPAKATTVATAVAYVWEQYLLSDLRVSSDPVLLPQHLSMHKQVLAGPLVLQVNEIVNIAEPLERRYEQSHSGKRMLKLHLSDGVHAIVAAELEHVPQLNIDLLAGCKVEISRVKLLQGMMMLTASSIKVLGGHVEQLVELANKTRLEVKRGLLPKEWMEELKDSIVSDAPASAMNLLGSTSRNQTQTLATPSAPPRTATSALMPISQNTPAPTPVARKSSFSPQLSPPSTTPARPMTTLDLTDSPATIVETSINAPEPSRQFGFIDIDEDDGIDFNAIEAALKDVQSPKPAAPPSTATPRNVPSTNPIPQRAPSKSFPSAAASRRALGDDHEGDLNAMKDFQEEDEEILRIIHEEMEEFQRPPQKPRSLLKPNIGPPPPPLPVDREIDEKGSDPPISTEDLYKSFMRPSSLLAPVHSSRPFSGVDPASKSSAPPQPPIQVQDLEDDTFDRRSLNNVTPRSNKRLKKMDGSALKRIDLDEIPESPLLINDDVSALPQPPSLPTLPPTPKPQATLIEIEDSPDPIRRKGGTINDFFTPKSAHLQISKRPEPKIIDMVDDDEDLPDDVPPERAKPKSPDVDHMEIVPEFEVETFIPAVPLTSPLQSILKRTEIQVSPPAAPKPAPIVLPTIENDDLEMDCEPQEPPLVYINDTRRFKPSQARVKGFVCGVVKDTFRVVEDKFTMQIKIDDGSGVAVVRLSHEMLLTLVGMPVDKYYQMQTSVQQQKSLKLKMVGMTKRLQQMNGVFYLDKWNSVDPVVTKYTPVVGISQELGWELLNRLED